MPCSSSKKKDKVNKHIRHQHKQEPKCQRTAMDAARAKVMLLLLAAAESVYLVGRATAEQASGVVATYNLYNPEQNNWDLGAAGAFCATWDADMPLAWRQQYGWTAFCDPAGAHGELSCGCCLLVSTLNKKYVNCR